MIPQIHGVHSGQIHGHRKWTSVFQRLGEQRMVANGFVQVSVWGDETWKQIVVTVV